MRALKKLILVGVIAFAVLQISRPGIPEKPAVAEIQAPPEIRRILDKSCYSCHSDQRRLSWFDEVVPVYWLVRHDVLTAREHLNFSTIGAAPAASQKARLYEGVSLIELGAMPLPDFLKLHPGAKVTPQELATLKNYLNPWTPAPPVGTGDVGGGQSAAALSAVPAEFNGLPFDPSFESWKLLSTTDRGDNGTFRFILGNDIAMKAAASGNVSSWPDGSRLAKIAWQQETGPDGLIRPGKFIQVELMVKVAAHYKSSQGWGYGRWRGLDLKPYGQDAGFVNECTGCHQPMRPNDYVYTLPVVANNAVAALPASLPYQPFDWRAITMYVDQNSHTMATLYGNDTVRALVTWAQREDPHWFGARIAGTPQSVEFVEGANYRRFAGAGLVEDRSGDASERAKFIMALATARLP